MTSPIVVALEVIGLPRQWRDILGLLTAQGATLDLASLRNDAEATDLDDLLDRARAEADLRGLTRTRLLPPGEWLLRSTR